MTTQLTKSGHSLRLHIPKAIADQAQIQEGDAVELTVQGGAIVIRPARPRYSLDELVRRITPRNRHGETD